MPSLRATPLLPFAILFILPTQDAERIRRLDFVERLRHLAGLELDRREIETRRPAVGQRLVGGEELPLLPSLLVAILVVGVTFELLGLLVPEHLGVPPPADSPVGVVRCVAERVAELILFADHVQPP